MRGVLALTIVLLVAGCATPSDEVAAESLDAEPVVFVEDYALGNETVPREELQNATLGTEHVHDLWMGKEELVLLDATAEAGLCEGPVDAAAYLFVHALGDQEAAYGCVRLSLPNGTVVPEGTAELAIEIDATQALKSGSLALQWRNKAREVDEETTTEPKHAWTVPLTPEDWDLPHATATTFVIYVASRGPAGAFEGPVSVRVVAQRIPDWEPVLAVAHVDHWKLPALHDLPAEGVMRLYDGQAGVTNVDPALFLGGEGPAPVVLSDIVPPGTAYLTILADETGSDCAPVLHCWLVPELNVGGYWRTAFGEILLDEGGRRVYQWAVPEVVPEDSVYANVSTTTINPRIDACGPDGEATCGLASIASTSASARLLVLAWQGEPDLDLMQQIADG